MVEPNCFTGRVWEATPADQLVRDLVTGPGALPMADAGVAFGQLSTVLAEAAVEYHAILGELGSAWRSADSDAGVQRLAALRNWMVEAAEAAATNAARAEAQAIAYTMAAAAMPGEAEQAVWQALKDMTALGIPLGGPLVGAAATLEDQAHAVKARAAQVMQDYEAATAPVAQPWTPPPAPVLTSDAALVAEQQHDVPRSPMTRPGPAPLPASAGYRVPSISPALRTIAPTPAAALGETVLVDEQIVTDQQVIETTAPATQVTQAPMVPGTMAPAATADADEYTPARPAAGPGGGAEFDALAPDAGWAATPPVLGGTSAPQVRTIGAGEAQI
ncbi:PPE domain-containing protein [Nocardia sp. NPDC004604]|uniref:PPE domain-containing protein n=1 Tax=Nocardia sp. NPDC004604 TaxID=3157013 RepID=UPI0033B12476